MKLENRVYVVAVVLSFILFFYFVLFLLLYMAFIFPPKIQTNVKILLEKSLFLG